MADETPNADEEITPSEPTSYRCTNHFTKAVKNYSKFYPNIISVQHRGNDEITKYNINAKIGEYKVAICNDNDSMRIVCSCDSDLEDDYCDHMKIMFSHFGESFLKMYQFDTSLKSYEREHG